ncbi:MULTISPECIES: serine hydrolase domain-containing protein [Streptomyces]|uniref:Serine hydrolase domain-containing protein n=2 Tax=Streptomyces TaxID=1883 RepID=A0ABU4K5K2_9ACTN|nr:serine hydrolase domain-containing protein [Streptomyces roseolus]MDX2292849.1 serine hydrolase domain-containing protein [Streptomyces roseolus]
MAERAEVPPYARLLADAVRDGVCPGAVWAVGNASGTWSAGAVGVLDPARPEEPVRPDTLFDVASLTKILSVWAVTGTLVDAGKLDLSAPLGTFWPAAAGRPVGSVTPHHLLTHTAGMPLRANLRFLYGSDPQDVRDGVLAEPLRHPPGAAVAYTDRAALVLGWLAEHLTGRPLARLAEERVWAPLAMRDTHWGPLPPEAAVRCAPTEYDEETGRHLKGTVHDFSARLLGGACGIAGVFTTAGDTGRFLRGVLDPPPGTFSAAWAAASLRVGTGNLGPARGLLWHPAPGTAPADDVWAHFGFTGTAMWVSPARARWAVLLTNRLYVTRDPAPLARVREAFRAHAFA